MRAGLLAEMAKMRLAVIRTLLAAMLLPLLAGLLPQPALSAEQALARDLAISLCSPDRTGAPSGSPASHRHDQSCILCVAGCIHMGAANLPRPVIQPERRATSGLPLAPAARRTDRDFAFWRSALHPRAPPAI